MVAFEGAVPPVGTVLRTTDLAVPMGKFVDVESGDGSVVVVPFWEIQSGHLGDVVGSCVEIVARETDFVGSFLLCRATETAWVVMDYTQGLPSFVDLTDWGLVHRVARLYRVFEDLASDVDVDDWLQVHTHINDVIS